MMKVDKQDRNGVRVRVHRYDDGTYVDASCDCYGHPWRAHSSLHCPFMPQAVNAPEPGMHNG